MAVELGTGYVSVIPSARGFGRSLAAQISAPLNVAGANAGVSASRAFGGKFIAGLAAVSKRAGTALGLGLAGVGGFGVKVAADFEQTRIAFEGILGSADEADKRLRQLRKFARATPFEFKGLAESAKQLLAVGFSAEEIIPTMTTLGNVAATLGVGEVEIQGVVRALGQMQGKGKASAEELQQISEQIPGFSAIRAIAEDLGITTAEAFEQMRKGSISADVAITAILNGMQRFPGAAGAMERQSKTLNGVISTLKDTFRDALIDGIEPLLPGISKALQGVGTKLQTVLPAAVEGVRSAIQSITPFVTGVLESLSGWFDKNGDDIKNFFVSLAEIVRTQIGESDSIFRRLVQGLYDLASFIADNKAATYAFLGGVTAGFVAWAAAASSAAIATLIAIAPFLLLGAAVGLVIYGIMKLVEWFKEAKGWGEKVERVVKLLASGLALFNIPITLTILFFDQLVAAVKQAYEWVKDLFDLISDIPSKLDDMLSPGNNRAKIAEAIRLRDLEGRAMGGPVTAHTPYIVGEEGPEIFVPSGNGTIIPNGVGTGLSQVINVYNPKSEPSSSSMAAAMRRAALAFGN